MAEKLKEMFFTSSSVDALAGTLERFHPDFDRDRFVALVFDESCDGKELKARMRHATERNFRRIQGYRGLWMLKAKFQDSVVVDSPRMVA